MMLVMMLAMLFMTKSGQRPRHKRKTTRHKTRGIRRPNRVNKCSMANPSTLLKNPPAPTIAPPIRKAQPQVHLKFPLVILQPITPIPIIPQPTTPSNFRTQKIHLLGLMTKLFNTFMNKVTLDQDRAWMASWMENSWILWFK